MVGQVAVLAVLSATVGIGLRGWVAGLVPMCVIIPLLRRGSGRAARGSRAGTAVGKQLGPAGRVTLVRATLVGGVAALVVGGSGVSAQWVLVGLASAAIVLDGVDGRVARRRRVTTQDGARFDMELDAFFLLVLSAGLVPSLGAWVLAVGLMRYAFALAALIRPWLRAPLPPSLARKAVAATQAVALTAASAPTVPRPAAATIVGVALVLLGWSFGRDIVHLARRRSARIAG
jgi:phosphatidylglycerophosphate synthase